MPALDNPQHEVFAKEYWLSFNATEAAKRAGYSPKNAHNTGARLLKDASIQQRLAELREAAEERYDISEDRVMQHLAAIAFQNISDFMEFTSDGDPILDVSKATKLQRACISKIKVEDYLDGRGEDARDIRKTEITLHPKLPALVKLGEKMGYFKDPEDSENERAAKFAAALLEITRQKPTDLVQANKELVEKAKGEDE